MKNSKLFDKVKPLANKFRFQIVELTQENEYNISQLASKLNLSYTTCADYVSILHKAGLLSKNQVGKDVFVKSLIKINDNSINFQKK